ncbi:MAG: CDP-alcohol phosphatidyltransferase family protein [Deltaproteobacteria bacterium]|jgi:cardiolipin synthase|nr:CDP-alcohol phosphatidyltransferase family protein [Deltaproteobacteria bacterium]
MGNKLLNINIPNILTVSRILLTPLFVIYLVKGMFQFALLVFTIAAISDGLDGLLARYFNQHSALGAYLDPIADKLLLASAFVSLAVLKIIPAWLTIIVLSRDILIVTGIAVFTLMRIPFEIKPSLVSKWTTVFQSLTIFLILLDPKISGIYIFKSSMIWITAGLTTTSGFHYVYFALNALQSTSGKNQKP